MKERLPEQHHLDFFRKHLSYGPLTGVVRWRNPSSIRVKDGQEAGYTSSQGYRRLTLSRNGKQRMFAMHRVVWYLWYGIWPTSEIDHRDRNKGNNCIQNLRLVSRPQNVRNQGLHCKNKSGFRGVHFRRDVGKWRAKAYNSGEQINLGYYSTPEEASAAVEAFYKKLDGSDYLPPRR